MGNFRTRGGFKSANPKMQGASTTPVAQSRTLPPAQELGRTMSPEERAYRDGDAFHHIDETHPGRFGD